MILIDCYEFLKIVLKNYFRVRDFFKTKKNCKIYFFKVPSEVLFSFLDYDIIKTVSSRIEVLKNYKQHDEEDIKKSIKLSWLIRELKNNEVKNPIQLLKKGEKYFCHPGTDRILVTTYIHPKKFIEGFYIWYPDLDSDPFIFDYEHFEIKNPFQFFIKFKYSKSFKFKKITLNLNSDVSDKDTDCFAMFATAKDCFLKTDKNFNNTFLSYRDKMQYKKIKDIKVSEAIQFLRDDLCIFGDVLFEKKKDVWLVKRD